MDPPTVPALESAGATAAPALPSLALAPLGLPSTAGADVSGDAAATTRPAEGYSSHHDGLGRAAPFTPTLALPASVDAPSLPRAAARVHPQLPPQLHVNMGETARQLGLLDSCRDVISEVRPFLFVSGGGPASSRSSLAAAGITHVVNLSSEHLRARFDDLVTYAATWNLLDSKRQPISQYFYPFIAAVEECRLGSLPPPGPAPGRGPPHKRPGADEHEGAAAPSPQAALFQCEPGASVFPSARRDGGSGRPLRLLVHCHVGVSRSCTLAIAYIMWRDGLPFAQALEDVKRARPVCNPNIGFMTQLIGFGVRLRRERQLQQPQLLQTDVGAEDAAPDSSVLVHPVRFDSNERRYLVFLPQEREEAAAAAVATAAPVATGTAEDGDAAAVRWRVNNEAMRSDCVYLVALWGARPPPPAPLVPASSAAQPSQRRDGTGHHHHLHRQQQQRQRQSQPRRQSQACPCAYHSFYVWVGATAADRALQVEAAQRAAFQFQTLSLARGAGAAGGGGVGRCGGQGHGQAQRQREGRELDGGAATVVAQVVEAGAEPAKLRPWVTATAGRADGGGSGGGGGGGVGHAGRSEAEAEGEGDPPSLSLSLPVSVRAPQLATRCRQDWSGRRGGRARVISEDGESDGEEGSIPGSPLSPSSSSSNSAGPADDGSAAAADADGNADAAPAQLYQFTAAATATTGGEWEHFKVYSYDDLQQFSCAVHAPASNTVYCWLCASDARLDDAGIVASLRRHLPHVVEPPRAGATAPVLVVEREGCESEAFFAAFNSGL